MALTDDQIIKLGENAKQLATSVEFQAIVGAVQAEAFREWHNSKPEECTKRENSYHLMAATKKFVENLDIMVQNGSFAARKAEEASAAAFRDRDQQKGELNV